MPKQIAGHGPNLGHGYVKYIIIGPDGTELPPVIFPAQIAPAHRSPSGALREALTVKLGDESCPRIFWVGEDARLGQSLSLLGQGRLTDVDFLPALLKGALARFGHLNGAATGYCVAGLPATWAADQAKAVQLGARLRAATPHYSGIRVIAEPLGLIYSELLDTHGEIVGDTALSDGRVGVVDLGHLTVDLAVLQQLQVVPTALETFQLGSAVPLAALRARLSATFDTDLSLHQADLVARSGHITIAGRRRDLPLGWDVPLNEHALVVARRLVEAWRSGANLDAIRIGGGGALDGRLLQAITRAFPHAEAVADPQVAIARGYAKLARRLGRSQ